ncbi:GTP cyclohydrolase II [Leptotrichia sp. OH3620_COT-345]|uniref:GTP cyclohydrolase II n=1 Tax=Leptotrichia sp. OH3620_COT-345 TaxID=2491048 RepID=UPI000F653598|nr:GTP cyclohydrolase II [Leptotrichia sp. OH3620_COT-345]RRD38758.1 GTP cyclohydrolase II [Leptotrichia sp. OH3620_COT-345]
MNSNKKFNTVEEVLEDIKKGIPIVIVDNEDRENEGDLFLAAQAATYEGINFMINEARGLMCVPISEKRAEELKLELMTPNNTDYHGTAFTVSVDAFEGTTTGISTLDRLKTVQDIGDLTKSAKDFRKPGHIFPLIAKKRGVLERKGHTEAAVDLSRIAGFFEAGVIMEILNEDGSMARRDDLFRFCKKHSLKIITIEDLIIFRKNNERLVKKEAETDIVTKFGKFTFSGYSDIIEDKEYIAVVKGSVKDKENISVRLHSECLTGDVFGSMHCDCGEQLHRALKEIELKGEGVLIYLRQEGRGIGIFNKLKAYKYQNEGYDTVEANHLLGFNGDLRDYAVAAQIIKELGIKSVSLKTNNPLKIKGLKKYGINVVSREEIEIQPNEFDIKYLKTKKEKMGHIFSQNL